MNNSGRKRLFDDGSTVVVPPPNGGNTVVAAQTDGGSTEIERHSVTPPKLDKYMEENEDELSANASEGNKHHSNQSGIMREFGTFAKAVIESKESFFDLLAKYERLTKEFAEDGTAIQNLHKSRTTLLKPINVLAREAAKEMKTHAMKWGNLYKSFVYMKHPNMPPDNLNNVGNAFESHAATFTETLSTMQDAAANTVAKFGVVESFDEIQANAAIKNLVDTVHRYLQQGDSAEKICSSLIPDQEPLNRRSLFIAAKSTPSKLILVFKKGDDKAHVYSQRSTATAGAEPEHFLVWIEQEKVLHTSDYLWCTAVIGDVESFETGVQQTLGLPDGSKLDGLFK